MRVDAAACLSVFAAARDPGRARCLQVHRAIAKDRARRLREERARRSCVVSSIRKSAAVLVFWPEVTRARSNRTVRAGTARQDDRTWRYS